MFKQRRTQAGLNQGSKGSIVSYEQKVKCSLDYWQENPISICTFTFVKRQHIKLVIDGPKFSQFSRDLMNCLPMYDCPCSTEVDL